MTDQASDSGRGYWLLDRNGGMHCLGNAPYWGHYHGDHPAVGLAARPDGRSYWILKWTGGVNWYGDDGYDGDSFGGHDEGSDDFVAISATTHDGYWIVRNDGDIHALGDATPFSDTSADAGDGDVVSVAGVSTDGLYILFSGGSIHTRGTAKNVGSPKADGSSHRSVAITRSPSLSDSYWVLLDNGKVKAYGAADHHGDLADEGYTMIDIAATPSGKGYWILGIHDGERDVWAFGDARYCGTAQFSVGSGAEFVAITATGSAWSKPDVFYDTKALASLYAPKKWNHKDGFALEFTDQDTDYRLYKPSIGQRLDDADGYELKIQIDHMRSTANDDHFYAKLYVDEHGWISNPPDGWDWSVKIDYGKSEVPQWLVTATDELGKLFDQKNVARAFDYVYKALDLLFVAIGGITDDGGRLNLSAVAAHGVMRVASTLYPASEDPPPTIIALDDAAFVSHVDGKGWNDKGGAATKYGAGDSDAQWRTWTPTQTAAPHRGGLLVSFKVDRINDGADDDHIIVMMGFNQDGVLVVATANTRFSGSAGGTHKSGVKIGQGSTSGAIASSVVDQVYQQLEQQTAAYAGGFDNDRIYVPDVVKRNMQAAVQAVAVQSS